ncbi:MAG: 3-phosphoshikimate 1-carboxyvinyltransferase [Clostridia bacterium]|nr:3-phosphoshikimate 1-carboxyvinyltransferase [Clostridia bacterium]
MRAVITASVARGKVHAPPSKSMAHRLLISAMLAEGESRIRGISVCDDVLATIDCMRALGVYAEICEGDAIVRGINMKRISPTSPLPCRESGSTLRFLIPIAMLCGMCVSFRGSSGLMSRPLSVYEELAREKGLGFLSDTESITVKGPLTAGDYFVVGNVSSQFISGLLFALPLLKKTSRIHITPPIESRPYIDMTIQALSAFGVKASWEDEHTLLIPGGQKYLPADIEVEGDYSAAAFIEALNLFGGEAEVDGLYEDSLQGDRAYRKYFKQLELGTPTIHIGDCPDLGPILFAVAAAKNGGIFSGTRRLKIKESDRAAAMAEELTKFGASVTVYDDKVVVYPADFHAPEERLLGHNDHRIVMAMAVLCSITGGELVGVEAINKSYPDFFRHLTSLGIGVKEYEDNL